MEIKTSTQRKGFLPALEYLLKIIAEYGMPTVAFGAGIYILLQGFLSPEYMVVVALTLVLIGIVSQLWIYSRENPPVKSDEVHDALTRMIDLVERLVDKR